MGYFDGSDQLEFNPSCLQVFSFRDLNDCNSANKIFVLTKIQVMFKYITHVFSYFRCEL